MLVLLILACATEPSAPDETPTPTATEVPAATAPKAAPTEPAAPSEPAPEAAPVPSPITRLPSPSEVPFKPVGLDNKDFVPEIDLPDLQNGGRFKLSDHVGPTATAPTKVVLVSISASWCGPCRASLPHFAQLVEEHGDALQIVIVSMDEKQAGRDQEVRQVREAGLDLPVVHADEALLRAYTGDKRNIPHFYIINKAGQVLVQDRGYGDKVKKVLPGQLAYAMNHPDYVAPR